MQPRLAGVGVSQDFAGGSSHGSSQSLMVNNCIVFIKGIKFYHAIGPALD